MIRTTACDVLGIAHPIVLAPMGGASSPELAAAVSEAGGLGTLACSWSSIDDIRAAIAETRRRTSRPFAVNFVVHVADPAAIDAAIAERVPVLSLFRGDPTEAVGKAKRAGIKTMLQITTAAEADQAVALGVDVITAQGREAGGHMGPEPLWSLLPEIVVRAGARPVLAAGGLVDGKDLAAALVMGAAGIAMGTRFIASDEAPVAKRHKQAILAAGEGATIDSEVWDKLWATEWPGVKARAMRDPNYDRWIGRPDELAAEIDSVRAAFERARGNVETTLPLLAGTGSARIKDIKAVAQIVRETVEEAERVLHSAIDKVVT